MKQVHWVIQENQGDSAAVRLLCEALTLQGHVCHLVWFTKSLEIPPIPDLPDCAPVVCYGQGFVTRASHHPRLKSGLFFDPATFCWDAFRVGWHGAMLSSDGRIVTLAEAEALLETGVTAFIRPNADSKIFDGGIYDRRALLALAEKSAIPESTLVVVASPLNLEVEWRFFVVNREIVACTEYRRGNTHSVDGAVPRSAIDLAADLALRWSPADIYCLDLGLAGKVVGVIEANCFNASRFYGASIDRIVRAINLYVLSRIPSVQF
jgi:hypothetical protein